MALTALLSVLPPGMKSAMEAIMGRCPASGGGADAMPALPSPSLEKAPSTTRRGWAPSGQPSTAAATNDDHDDNLDKTTLSPHSA